MLTFQLLRYMTKHFWYQKNSIKKCAQAMSCEKKNFKRLKRDLPPIRWQDEDLCDDREDASKMMQYLKRICVEFEQMEEKIQSQFFLHRKNDRKKGKCKDSFSPLGKTWKLYHWIEKKKAVMKSLLGRICFCPHFLTTARLCPWFLNFWWHFNHHNS